MNCPYCLNQAEWVENKEVYGKNYGKSVMIWLCRKCDAYVGCHQNTRKPLGTMANKELRTFRKETHKVFDVAWRNKTITRDKAYGFLKSRFGFDVHIGEANIELCKKIIELCKTNSWFNKLNKESL